MPTDHSNQQIDSANKLYTLGMEKYRANQHDEAIACFNNLLSQNEWYLDALACRGYIYMARYDYSLALNDFNRWMAHYKDATHTRIRLDMAFLQIKLGQYQEAIKACNQIIDLDINIQSSTRQPAEALINNSVNVRSRAFYLRGECHFLMKNRPDALTDYLSSQQENKNEAHHRLSLQIAKIYLMQNQYSEALASLDTLNSHTLENGYLIWFLELRSSVYTSMKNTKMALVDVERISKLELPAARKQYFEQIKYFLRGENIAANKVMSQTAPRIENPSEQSNDDAHESIPRGKSIYKSTVEGSSIELDGLLFQPATNEAVRNGIVANTRFFKASNPSTACLVVKREQMLHALKTTKSDQQYMNEAKAWNAMYPRYPAHFFEFPHAACRLALPRLPGISMNTAGTHRQQEYAHCLQTIMAIGLELQRLHDLKWIHGDLKPDNIILDFNRKIGCYQPKLVDFGLATQVGQLCGAYRGKHSNHIAPELYGSSEIPSAFSADIYSFSATILMCFEKVLPEDLVNFLKTKGCANDANSRPSITELLTKLWSTLIQQLSMDADDDPKSRTGDIDNHSLIANFITKLEPSSFIILMNAINQSDKQHQSQLKNHSVIVNIIIKTYEQYKKNLPPCSGFIQELLESAVESLNNQV